MCCVWFKNLKKYSHYISSVRTQRFYAKIIFSEKQNTPLEKKKKRNNTAPLFVLLYRQLQFIIVGPAEGGQNVLVFNKNKSRHGHDVIFNSNILTLINIHLETKIV